MTHGQAPVSYIDYHQKCRQAESLFINDEKDSCLNLYLNTFQSYEYHFPRDCFMAAQIAHKSNKDSLSVAFLLDGIKFGLNPEILSQRGILATQMSSLIRTVYWQSIELQKDSLFEIYKNSVNWELKNRLGQIIILDQELRTENNKWFNRTFRKGLEKKYQVINQKHIDYLDSVFKSVGYPGSWLIGVGDSVGLNNEYAVFNNVNLNEISYIILYHYDSSYVKYGDFLLEEVTKGHIHPRTYAMIRDFRDRHLVSKDKNEKMYFNVWWERKNFDSEVFTEHCNKIGCPTKQHLRELGNKLGSGYDVFWYPFR